MLLKITSNTYVNLWLNESKLLHCYVVLFCFLTADKQAIFLLSVTTSNVSKILAINNNGKGTKGSGWKNSDNWKAPSLQCPRFLCFFSGCLTPHDSSETFSDLVENMSSVFLHKQQQNKLELRV